MKTVVLDNYDSFTYNLVYLLKEFIEGGLDVYRNDEVTIEKLMEYDQIVLSPGPGLPKQSGILCDAVKMLFNKKKILGVCLGHQAIYENFGGRLENMQKVMHGVSSKITLSDDSLFKGLPKKIEVGRYHSWVAKNPLPKELKVIAKDSVGGIMAIKHKLFPVYGLQFHPESILTPQGGEIVKNWLYL
jgi:anthranilate synthase component 2